MKPIAFLTAAITLIAMLGGCLPGIGQTEPRDDSGEIPVEAIPNEIRSWVENSRHIPAGQAFNHGDRTYFLLTSGEKPTGGYKARIVSLDVDQGELVALCRFEEPSSDQPRTEALSYPYDLVTVPKLRVPVRFEAEGGAYIMKVLSPGVEPIVAENTWIKVYEPSPGQVATDTLRVRGLCSTFEGTVNFQLTRDEAVLYEGFATGAMGDWGYFDASVPISALEAGPAVLKVFTYSAKDGSVENAIPIEVVISGN